jgi:thiosulfate/3-mercaptopyruvate sulfurtransferase
MVPDQPSGLPPVIDRVPADAVLADVRWYLDGRSGRAAYEAGHLPGAVFVDLDAALSGHDLDPTDGRHPLPDPDDFAAAMGALGIGDDTPVVAYDDTGGMTAGRLVVMLRMLDHPAAVLDGGLRAHVGRLETGSGEPKPPRPFTARPWPADRLADADQVASVAASPGGRVLDARSWARFTGEVTLIDPRPGHIPGARSAPWEDTLDPETGRFREPHELFERFAALGIDEQTDVVAACGSGVSACMNVLAAERAGLPPPRLYVASFSGWSADADREVELGPGAD